MAVNRVGKFGSSRKRYRTACAAAVASLAMTSAAFAADSTWTTLTSGNASGIWDTASNWNSGSGPVADGSGFNANFNTLDISATSTVTLSSGRTIGSLTFGDTTISSAASWVLSNGGTAANGL